MIVVLREDGLAVAREFPLTARFRGQVVGEFRADLLVAGKVLVELKAVRSLDSSHEGQLLNYLRCSVVEVGLLLNFGRKPEVKRFAYENHRKIASGHSAMATGPGSNPSQSASIRGQP